MWSCGSEPYKCLKAGWLLFVEIWNVSTDAIFLMRLNVLEWCYSCRKNYPFFWFLIYVVTENISNLSFSLLNKLNYNDYLREIVATFWVALITVLQIKCILRKIKLSFIHLLGITNFRPRRYPRTISVGLTHRNWLFGIKVSYLKCPSLSPNLR